MLTFPQRAWIVDRSNSKGQMACPGANGFIKASWLKVMEHLRDLGLAERGAHGEYVLTGKGEAYKEGALAAEIVWLDHSVSQDYLPSLSGVHELVSAVIGPNVHHPDETRAGAVERWGDLRACRAFARCQKLPRHGGAA